MRTIVSIHDVMPHTLPQTAKLIDLCRQHGIRKIALLVVPGLNWSPPQLDLLRGWSNDRCELAAHGWSHKAKAIRTLGHRLHSYLISRDCAEHLSTPAEVLAELMARSHAWFVQNQLPAPSLYVPPAWALGAISIESLRCLPYQSIETLTSVLFPNQQRRTFLPLIGFEADTQLRATLLAASNQLALRLAARRQLVLRIGLHPFDLELQLAHTIPKILSVSTQDMSYLELLTAIE